jgi:hypothetical protein
MSILDLAGKNILVFFPNGKGNYGSAVALELERRGAKVFIYDERPDSKTLTKIAYRIAKEKLQQFFLHYLKKIISENIGISFDLIIVIRAEAFTPLAMKHLRQSFPYARFILYLWDSVRYTNTASIFPYFDKILSFDKNDVETYHLFHRPLFFIDVYREIADQTVRDYDVIFIGKIHSDRYFFLKKMENQLESNGYSTFFYLYLPSKLLFYQMKLQEPSFKRARLREFKFRIMPAKDVSRIMSLSRVSLDAQHPAQAGLTMRSLEVLGAKRKLITTNQDIKTYDFYNENNIYVVDRQEPMIDFEFIRSPYVEIPINTYEKYSLQGWLDDLLNI